MLNKELHRTILFKLVKDIFSSNIGKYLAFKWGTACYFLHNLDRFSTDLDFDLLDAAQNIDTDIVQIARKYGTVKKGNKLIISYWEKDINIKIDISRKIRKNNKYEIVNFYWTDIKVQDKSTIFANKIVALYERYTNRDIYDVNFFLNHLFPLNENIINERTGKTMKKVLEEIKSKLQKLPKWYKILDWLWEVLDENQKTFVKQKLLPELIWIIDMKIDYS